MAGALCISLTPAALDGIFASDLTGADLAEIRLDYLPQPQDAATIRWDRLPIPVIATCRGQQFGGRFRGSVEAEISILRTAAQNGARYVDLDYRIAQPVTGASLIASYHDFNKTPDDLQRHFAKSAAGPGAIIKVATLVKTWSDNQRLLHLLSDKTAKPAIVVGMGEMGQITRLIGPARGSFLTYAANETQAAAAGQLTVREMIEIYRFRKISASTKVLGILGNPVGHSKSPEIHNRAFEALGLDFVYLKFPATDVGEFFAAAETIGIRGFSVTIPHKTAVIPFLTSLSDAAREVGAVNTVTYQNGGWHGDNTDVVGIREALNSIGFEPSGRRVVILGAGGAARAAVAALRNAKDIVVLSRRRNDDDWGTPVRFDRLERIAQYPCDLLVNATPVGMSPHVNESPVQGAIEANIVFDMVYNPAETALLRAARAQGKSVIPGTTMFAAQAARQFEIWTGRRMAS